MNAQSRRDSIRQRKRRYWWKTFSAFLAMITIGIGAYGILFSRIFCIQTIRARGNDDFSQAIQQAAWDAIWKQQQSIIPKNNILFVNKAYVSARLLEQFPDIQQFHMTYDIIAKTLDITNVEREAVGVVCKPNGPCHFVDSKGILFHTTDGFELDKLAIMDETEKPLSTGIDTPYANRNFIAILQAYWNAAQHVIPITSILVKSDSLQAGYVQLNTSENWYVLVHTSMDPHATMQKVATIIRTEFEGKTNKLQYIDARYTDKVYYK